MQKTLPNLTRLYIFFNVHKCSSNIKGSTTFSKQDFPTQAFHTFETLQHFTQLYNRFKHFLRQKTSNTTLYSVIILQNFTQLYKTSQQFTSLNTTWIHCFAQRLSTTLHTFTTLNNTSHNSTQLCKLFLITESYTIVQHFTQIHTNHTQLQKYKTETSQRQHSTQTFRKVIHNSTNYTQIDQQFTNITISTILQPFSQLYTNLQTSTTIYSTFTQLCTTLQKSQQLRSILQHVTKLNTTLQHYTQLLTILRNFTQLYIIYITLQKKALQNYTQLYKHFANNFKQIQHFTNFTQLYTSLHNLAQLYKPLHKLCKTNTKTLHN